MSGSPTPQKRFEIAVHEGYQFTERGHTQVKLLLSVSDFHGWVAWYKLGEGLLAPAVRAFDGILMDNRGRAESTVQFGDGPIDRATVQLRRPKTVDSFHIDSARKVTVARIHDAKFFAIKGANGPAAAERLELALSLDLGVGQNLETVNAKVSMLSTEHPKGSIYPVRGWLLKIGLQRLSTAPISPSRQLSADAAAAG